MKILVNGKFLTQKFSGVQRFAFELTKFLIKSELTELVIPKKIEFRYNHIYNRAKTKSVGITKGVSWEQIELPFYLKKLKGDKLLLNLGNTAPLIYEKNIVTSHGLAWKFYPHLYSKRFVSWYNFLIPRLLKKALLILTVSKTVKEELIEIYNIPEEKIEILYPGVSPFFRPLENISKNHYILFVGSINPIKNLSSLIEAFKLISEDFQELELWIVGESNVKIFVSQASYSGLQVSLIKRIKFLGFKEDNELVRLYSNALCLVLPSLYETFSFPVLEALACGCPVIVSDLKVMHELYGDSLLYINPLDPTDIASKIVTLLKKEEMRLKLREKGIKIAKEFTWEKSYERLRNILKTRFNVDL
ncbi:MAG: glycosyltransferase family 1 protein [Candidatus Aenigmatarchaeota archaeon]